MSVTCSQPRALVACAYSIYIILIKLKYLFHVANKRLVHEEYIIHFEVGLEYMIAYLWKYILPHKFKSKDGQRWELEEHS